MQESYTPGQLAIGSLTGTEKINVDNGGAVNVTVTAQQVANLGPAGNLTGPITTTGNITGGNLSTGGKIAATGNISGANLSGNVAATNGATGNFSLAATGNITVVAGIITAINP